MPIAYDCGLQACSSRRWCKGDTKPCSSIKATIGFWRRLHVPLPHVGSCMQREHWVNVSIRHLRLQPTLLCADTDLELRLQQLPEAPPAPVADLEYVSDDEQTSSLLCAMPDRVRSLSLLADRSCA